MICYNKTRFSLILGKKSISHVALCHKIAQEKFAKKN